MVYEMLQKLKFLLHVLYSRYIKFYFSCIFHIYAICFIIYLYLHYIFLNFVIYFYFHIT